MIIKRYLVDNINEALTKIRYELGKDAVIISQRKVRKSGIKGLFGGKLIEVTAAVENSKSSTKNNRAIQQSNDLTTEEEFQNSVDSIKKLMESHTNSINEGKVNPQNNVNIDTNNNKLKTYQKAKITFTFSDGTDPKYIILEDNEKMGLDVFGLRKFLIEN